MMRGFVMGVFLAAAVLHGLMIFPLAAQDQPEVLSVNQAVKIGLANNRVLKITSLGTNPPLPSST
jgi:hypothetical protein